MIAAHCGIPHRIHFSLSEQRRRLFLKTAAEFLRLFRHGSDTLRQESGSPDFCAGRVGVDIDDSRCWESAGENVIRSLPHSPQTSAGISAPPQPARTLFPCPTLSAACGRVRGFVRWGGREEKCWVGLPGVARIPDYRLYPPIPKPPFFSMSMLLLALLGLSPPNSVY